MSRRDERTEVLVVGAGPAGPTTAISLARAGIAALVVERHLGTSPFPKATGVSTRTMELMRCWGLEQRVRAGSMRVRPSITVSRTLTEPELMSSPTAFPTDDQVAGVSPARPCFCPQDHLEPVLLEHLIARGGRVRFGTELTELRTGRGGVEAELLDRASGQRSRVRADYVVGADGPSSAVRTALGIGVEDLGTLGEFVAVTFRADLTRRMPRTPSVINVVEIPDGGGLFVPTSTDDRWIYARQLDSERAETVADWPPATCVQRVRTAAGLPDLRPEILSVMSFEMGAQVATAFRSPEGRAFLVGDAAHRTTPEGGIGMNTAIHAAHNLGWKLAWVLRGHAGEALLDSYQAERRPVGTQNALRSVRRDADVDALAIDLGVRYTSAAVDPDAGCRAPHTWICRARLRVSTLDLFDGRLTVLTGPHGQHWRRAALGLAAEGLPVVGLTSGSNFHDENGDFAARYRLGEDGAVLVRPDGYLACRLDGPARDAPRALRAAVGRALGHDRRPALLAHAG